MLETSNPIILLPIAANYQPKKMWKTLVCLVVCFICQANKSYSEIRKATSLMRSIIQGIVKGPSSCITRKGKTFKLQS
jgi:cell shape-determining protein MreC